MAEPMPLMGRSAILGDQRNNNFCDADCGKGALHENTYAITKSGLLCVFNSRRLLDKWVRTLLASHSATAAIFNDCVPSISLRLRIRSHRTISAYDSLNFCEIGGTENFGRELDQCGRGPDIRRLQRWYRSLFRSSHASIHLYSAKTSPSRSRCCQRSQPLVSTLLWIS